MNYIVVYAAPDYDGRDVDVSLFRFDDPHKANQFAEQLADYESWVGSHGERYPATIYVLDLDGTKAFDDPSQWYEVFAERASEDVYEYHIQRGASEDDAGTAADTAYEETLNRR